MIPFQLATLGALPWIRPISPLYFFYFLVFLFLFSYHFLAFPLYFTCLDVRKDGRFSAIYEVLNVIPISCDPYGPRRDISRGCRLFACYPRVDLYTCYQSGSDFWSERGIRGNPINRGGGPRGLIPRQSPTPERGEY